MPEAMAEQIAMAAGALMVETECGRTWCSRRESNMPADSAATEYACGMFQPACVSIRWRERFALQNSTPAATTTIGLLSSRFNT